MEIYVKQLFGSFLKKANLLRSTAVFVLNLAAQTYTFASMWASLRTTVLHCRLLCRHTLRRPSVLELAVFPFWAHILSPPNQFEQAAWRLRDIAIFSQDNHPFTRAPQLHCSSWGLQEQPGEFQSSQVATEWQIPPPAIPCTPRDLAGRTRAVFLLFSISVDASWIT